MNTALPENNREGKYMPLFQITFWDILTGLPAGALIFMGTVLFSVWIGPGNGHSEYFPVVNLMIVTLLVGFLSGITRLRHGPATALWAGLVAAGLLFYLWISARPGEITYPIVISPIGMLIAVVFCPIGGWIGSRSRKAL
jgi:hypothetical protein